MPRFSRRQFSFTNGEVSPLLYGRSDMDFYFAGLAECVNWIPDHKGNLHRRPPTRFVGKSKDNECPCFIRFPVGRDCPLLVVAYRDCFQFINQGELLLDGAEALSIPHEYGDDFCELEYAQDCGALFITHENHPPALLEKTDDGITLSPLNSSPFARLNDDPECKLQLGGAPQGAFTNIGGQTGQPQQAGTQGQTVMSGIPCVVGDVVNLTNDGGQNFIPATVTRDRGGSVCEVTFSGDPGLYEVEGGGEVTISNTEACLSAVNCAPFTPDMVGQFIRVLDEDGDTTPDEQTDGNIWLELQVVNFQSPDKVIVNYDGVSIEETDFFQLPLFVGGKYPETVWIHQDRLWYGLDNCVVGSATGNFNDWSPTDEDGTVNPDNAIYEKVNNGQCSEVRWMWTAGNHLLTGTQQGVYSITGAGVNGSFQADAIAQRLNSNIGVADIRPVQVGESIVFVDRTRRKLYATGFGGQFEQVTFDELNLFADHIGDCKFKKITHQESPYNIVWGITDDNQLFSVTYDQRQNVKGWARHVIGGQLLINGCCENTRVCEVETVPGANEEFDDVYMVVERTVNGEDIYTIEVLERFHDTKDAIEDSIYLDAKIELDNSVRLPSQVLTFNQGPSGISHVADGDYALRDRDCWHYMSVQNQQYSFETNAIECPVPGRDMICVDGEWRQLEKIGYCEEQNFKSGMTAWRPPCDVREVRKGVSEITGGLECFAGEEMLAYSDGDTVDVTVNENGGADVGGSIVAVGYGYESRFKMLPFRQNLGSSDGANDQFTIRDVALYLLYGVHVEIGSGECDFYHAQLEAYERLKNEQSTHKRVDSFNGWQSTNAYTGHNDDNSEFGLAVRALGAYPCIVRGVEAIINANGGR